MDQDFENNGWGGTSNLIWIGVAVGAAVGIGIALSRSRRHDRWESAKHISERLADNSGDLTDAGRHILDRMRTIYDESRKVVEEASELWAHGRKLVRR